MRLHRSVLGLLLVVYVAASPHGEAPHAAAADAAAPHAAAADAWRWPVNPHRVVRGYGAPATAYSAGHRGIDLDVEPGQQVFAPADGVVSFAGTVVDRPLVSVQVDDGVLATVEPVQPAVSAGDAVHAGTLLGVVGTGGHCGPRCLHLGVRVHGRYVSPLLFLGGIPRAVLLPMDVGVAGQARGWAVR
jgi:murein DD-endopeptidase MepM/ murein hydrolase activator NlpD